MRKALEEDRMDKELSHWWDHMTYADAKNFIRDNIRSLARNYIAIGFYLRKVRDGNLFLDGEYTSVHEFAYEEFGMRKSTVNHCIRINAEFSEGGNSPAIDARYKEFGRAQLQELLYVPEERRDEVTPDMTVAEIREVHKPKRLDVEPKENREPGQKKSAVDSTENEPAAESGQVPEMKAPDIVHFTEAPTEPGAQDAEPQREMAGSLESIPDQEPDVADAEYQEEPVKITVQDLLYQKRRELAEWVEAMGDDDCTSVPGFVELKIIVQALELLAGQQDSQEGQESEIREKDQHPLPVLKNNAQRKEWLGKYHDWGLWYEDANIGARYYRYRFENGADLIVEEYQDHSEYAGDYTSSYFHLVGGPDAPRKSYNDCAWQRHERYSKFPNSETELVEFLKFVQKK